MPNGAVVLIAVAAALVGIAAWRLSGAWFRYHGRMVVTCPENQQPAGVSVDTRHAAATGLSGAQELRLSGCSRWPERAGCGQQCLSQIENAPDDCLVRSILVRWYAGKNCAWCGQPIGDIHAVEAKPTVLTPDKASMEWNEIPAERLRDTLATALPLCFSCHIANTMLRKHPELVIDRSRPSLSGGPHSPR